VVFPSFPTRRSSDLLCWNRGNGCAGDIRLNDWVAGGYGISKPVLFTARDGATLSGRLWATVAGPSKRPGVVITNGSVQTTPGRRSEEHTSELQSPCN